MTRKFSFVFLVLFLIALLAAGCGEKSDQASTQELLDDDSDPIIPNDDDSDDDSDDDDSDDDSDDDDTGMMEILSPTEGEVILGYQVPVEIQFKKVGDTYVVPSSLSLMIDQQNASALLNYAADEGRAWAEIGDVEEGLHTITVSATFDKTEETDTVSFETTLSGAPRIEMTMTPASVPINGQATASWIVYDANNYDITSIVDVQLGVDPTQGAAIDGNVITFSALGTYTVTASATYEGQPLSDSDDVLVYDTSDIARLEIDCTPDEVTAGDIVTCQHTIYDQDDNEVQGTVFYQADPAQGATINGNNLTLTLAADVTITGTVTGTQVTDTESVLVNAGEAAGVSLELDPPEIMVHETTTAITSVVDEYGNSVPGEVDLVVQPSTNVVIDGNEITVNEARLQPYIVHAYAMNDTYHAQANLTVGEDSLPVVTITSPARGQFLQTASINLQGTATDPDSEIDRVLVNGVQVYFNEETGIFTHSVSLEPGLNIIIVEAFDVFGNSDAANISAMYAGTYLANGDPVENAVAARITPAGFDNIEGIAEEMIEAMRPEIYGYLPDPLFHESVDLLIVEVTAEATLDDNGINYDPVNIELIPQNGGIRLEATASNLSVDGNVTVDLDWFDKGKEFLDLDFTVSATSIALTGNVAVSVIGDGELSVTLSEIDVAINGFNINLEGGLTGDVLEWVVGLFDDILVDLLKDMLVQMIEDEVTPLLDEMLSELDLSFTFDVLDFSYGFRADFNEIDFSPDGGTIWMNAESWYGDGSWTAPGPNTPDLPGSIRTITMPPTLGVYIPGTSTPYEFGVLMADDMLNQLLHMVHRSGLISLDLDQETLEQLGIEDFELNTTYLVFFMPGIVQAFGLNKPVELRLRPLLPPVFLMSPPDAETLNSEIQLGDFVLEWYCEEDPDVWTLFAKVALALFIPADVSVSEEQTISIEFGEIEMYADLFEEPVFDVGNDFFETLLPDIVELLVPPLLGSLLEEIPIPSFEGFTLNVLSFQAMGAALDWAGLFGNLVQVPAELQLLQAQQLYMFRELAR